jgi:hypothetical protein
MKNTKALASLILCFAFPLITEHPKVSVGVSVVPSDMHGTVNIVLANKNGAVAVTDSMLTGGIPKDGTRALCPGTISNGMYHMPCGQKLFRINNHTFLTVAGFYLTVGPIEELSADAPDEVSKALSWGNPSSEFPAAMPLDIMSRRIADTFEFDLTGILDEYQAKHMQFDTEQMHSQMIVAGYDTDGSLKIERKETSIWPGQDRAQVKDDREFNRRYPLKVEDKLVFVTAGLDDVANGALMHPEQFAPRYPSINRYAEAMRRDQGSSLSLPDMRALAIDLETMTAEKYEEVGGPVQVALLSRGGLSIDTKLVSPVKFEPHNYGLLLEESAIGPTYFSYDPALPGPSAGHPVFKISRDSSIIFFRDTLQGRYQVLDGNSFYDGSISDCYLVFKGGSFKLNNVVINNSIIVLANPKDAVSQSILALLGATKELRLATDPEREKVLDAIGLKQIK